MKKKFLILKTICLVIAIVFSSTARAEAVNTSPSSNKSYFALISPERLANIPKGKRRAAIGNAIRTADKSLSDKPNPLPDVHTEGLLPGQGNYNQIMVSLQDITKLESFALSYALRKDKKYLQAMEKFITAWLTTYKLSFNPIDETNFDRFIIAYDISRNDLSDSTKALMNDFLRKMATGYLDSINNQKEFAQYNWQAHRIKLLTLASFALGDDSLVKRSHDIFTKFIALNILPDSSVLDFKKRDALYIVNYDLEPLLVTCIAAKEHGQDWFNQKNPAGSSVASAVRWTIPYANGTLTHEEFVKTTVAFDKKLADAGLAEYSGTYNPVLSLRLFGLASVLNDFKDQDLVNTRNSIAQKYNKPIYGWLAVGFLGESNLFSKDGADSNSSTSISSNRSYFGIVSPERLANIPKNLTQQSKNFGVSNTALKAADKALTDTPAPLPYIHVEGTLPGEGIHDQSNVALQDLSKIENFALAYALNGDKKYLQALEKFLTAWLTTYKISFNPIDETNFYRFVIAYDISKKDLSDSTKNLMNDFLRKMATGYLDAISKQKVFDDQNLQAQRIKLITLASFALGDDSLIQKAHDVFTKFISLNIYADSSVKDFHTRDALHYAVGVVADLTITCIAAKEHGQDWFNQKNPAGSSVASAARWVIPYANGTKTHVEFANSKVAFDIKRANAGLAGYSGTYNPANSLTLFGLASILDDSKEQDLVNTRDLLMNNKGKNKKYIYGWISVVFLQ